MPDPRITKLAQILIHYSTSLQPAEKILIEAIDCPVFMTTELVRLAREAGADPLVFLKDTRIERALRQHASEAQMKLISDIEMLAMTNVQAYVGIRGNYNIAELADVPDEKQKLYLEHVWSKVHLEVRCNKTKWVVLRWPHPTMAQQAGMSTEAFEELFFAVCTIDYAKMARAMQPLVERINKANQVTIKGPGTDLQFSIAGMTGYAGDGRLNIPDGEVATSPVLDSVQGHIQYNTRTISDGLIHEHVFFQFEKGKIVKATSSNSGHLNQVLDRDAGARYIGEFALGLNPHMKRPILDILFDEKIARSFHFTPGDCFEQNTSCDNGNRSMVHWDLVCLQDEASGGGEIYFDNVLIRKNGLFVTADLMPLNPQNLIAGSAGDTA